MPNEGNNTQVKWKTDAAEFRGFVRASMGNLQKVTDEMKQDVKCIPGLKKDSEALKKEMKSIHGKISKLQLKVAGISGTIALIVTIIILLLKDKIF